MNCTRRASRPSTVPSVSTSLRLGEARHADQQAVAARQDRDQHLLDDLVLAEDDGAEGGAGGREGREGSLGGAGRAFLDRSDAVVLSQHGCIFLATPEGRASRDYAVAAPCRCAALSHKSTGAETRSSPPQWRAMMAKASDGPPGMAAPLDALIADAATRKGPAAGASVESALLRRHRHAHRPRRHVALRRLADRPARAGEALRLGAAARRGPVRAGDARSRRSASRSRMRPSWPSSLQGDPATGLRLRTNLDEWVTLGADHPLRFEPGPAAALKPYARVRGDLWALVTRPVFYELVAKGEVRDVAGRALFGVASGAELLSHDGGRGARRIRHGSGAWLSIGRARRPRRRRSSRRAPGRGCASTCRNAGTRSTAPAGGGDHVLDGRSFFTGVPRVRRRAGGHRHASRADRPADDPARDPAPAFRAGRLSRRQDRPRRRLAARRRFTRGRGGSRARPLRRDAARLPRPLSHRHGLHGGPRRLPPGAASATHRQPARGCGCLRGSPGLPDGSRQPPRKRRGR